MSTIEIPIETLRETSEKLSNIVTINQDLLDRMKNHVEGALQSQVWNGKDATEALNTLKKNRKKYKDVIKEIEEMSDFLKRYVEEIETSDSKTAASIQSK